MKPVIGKKLTGRRVVTTEGTHIGEVIDAYFEDGGILHTLVIKPEKETKELQDHIDKNHLLNVPFNSVQAIGRYVVVEFPFTKK